MTVRTREKCASLKETQRVSTPTDAEAAGPIIHERRLGRMPLLTKPKEQIMTTITPDIGRMPYQAEGWKHVWPSEKTFDDWGVCHGAVSGGAGAPSDDGVRRDLCRRVRSFDEVATRQP